MNRRSLIQILIGTIVAPPSGIRAETSSHSPALPAPTAPPVPELHEPSSLEAWQRLPMQPIPSFDALPSTATAIERRLAGIVLIHLQETQTDFEFTYHGGSQPGTRRRVIPVLLFQKITPEDTPESPLSSPIYLLAHCPARQASRTFRLDRISLGNPPSTPPVGKPPDFFL